LWQNSSGNFIVGLWRNGSAPAWHGRFAKRKGHIVQEAGGSKARIAAKSLWRFDEYAERQEFGNLTALRAVNPPESTFIFILEVTFLILSGKIAAWHPTR
jgi:hypothetical protein